MLTVLQLASMLQIRILGFRLDAKYQINNGEPFLVSCLPFLPIEAGNPQQQQTE
jgi:hypothetical protein